MWAVSGDSFRPPRPRLGPVAPARGVLGHHQVAGEIIALL